MTSARDQRRQQAGTVHTVGIGNRYLRLWVDKKIVDAVRMIDGATDGDAKAGKHPTLLRAARLCGGLLHTSVVSRAELAQTLHDAIARQPNVLDLDSADATIEDGLDYGAGSPLSIPELPTEQDLLVDDAGVAHCPSCDRPVIRSNYNFFLSSVPGWFCPACKGSMKWPNEAISDTAAQNQATGRGGTWSRATLEDSFDEPVQLDEPEFPDPPGDAAFLGLAGELVALADPHTESDRTAILLQFLASFGNAVGDGPHMKVGATRHQPRLFVALVGKTGRARKGDSWAIARKVMADADTEWAKHKIVSGIASGEGLIAQIRDQVEEQDTKKDGTPYTKVILPGTTDKRLFVIEGELARVIATMRRQGSTVSPILREAWDGNTLQNLTRKLPDRVTRPYITLVGHITAEELRRTLDDTELSNGLANRFLFAAVQRSKLLPRPDPFEGPMLVDFVARTGALLDWASKLQRVAFTADAEDLWDAVYPLLSADRDGLPGSLLARAEAHTLRTRAAVRLAGWLEHHQHRPYPVCRRALELLRALDPVDLWRSRW